ncbi:MAG: FtsX-like permease family protein [Byssovorax sp.]
MERATAPRANGAPRAGLLGLLGALLGALPRLLSTRNLRNDRFGTLAAVLGVAVGVATVSVVAILDVNTTAIEAQHAAATGPAAARSSRTVALVPVRGGVRIEPPADAPPPREDHEVLRAGIRAGSLSAFLLGALIVFFTFSAVIDRRLRELALLRSLGALPGQLAAIFLREAAVVGLAGAALGALGSIPTAIAAAKAGVTTTGHLKIDPAAMVFPWGTVLLIALVGALVAALGALRPLRAVWRIEISRSLRPLFLDAGHAPAPRPRAHLLRFLALPLVAAAYLALRPRALALASPLTFHAIEALVLAAVFVGALRLVPDLVRLLGARLVRLFPAGPGGSSAERLLVERRIEHFGHELSWSVSGVMLVFSLLLTLHLVTHALKREVVTWANEALTDETFVLPWYPKLRATMATASLPPSAKVLYLSGRTPWPNALHATKGADLVRFAEDTGRPALAEIARRLGPGKILLSRLMARRLAVDIGDAVDVETQTETRRLTVVGVSDALGFTPMNASHRRARTFGLIDAADMDLIAPLADPIGTVAIVAEASAPEMVRWRGAEPDKLITKNGIYLMTARFYEGLRLREANSDFIIFDLLLGLTSLLAGVGIANQLVLSVRARQRELALYRVLGMSPAQVRRLVVMEGAFIGMLGGCLAALLGVALGGTALGALRAISGFAVTLDVPLAYPLATIVGATVVTTLASLYPAARAAKGSAAESVHHE